MDKGRESEIKESATKKAVTYSFAQISDVAAYQTFTFLIFTFYYAVIGLDVRLISIGFIIWSVWNSLNDPILGYFSDRTHTRYGRRMPYIMIGFIPLSIMMFLLFNPPRSFGITNMSTNFIYFLIVIILFDLFYTMYSLNVTSLFPEIFNNFEDRVKANTVRQTFSIIGLFVAFLLPGFIISDYSDPNSIVQYQILGIVIMLIVMAGVILFLTLGPKERSEFQNDYKSAPKFIDSIKVCVKSKSFRWYLPTEIANWFVFSMFPTLIPLYGKFVLGVNDALILSLLMGIVFISAMIFINLLWKPVVGKIGPRKAWLISMTLLLAAMVPLMFISDVISGFIVFFLIGIGFGGSLYIIDIVVSDIVDEDETKTGIRREASYYGINSLGIRLNTILVFLAIGMVFTNVGWAVYEPENVTPAVILGLRVLMFVFPAIAITIGIISMSRYPLDGENLKKVKAEVEKLHGQKREKA